MKIIGKNISRVFPGTSLAIALLVINNPYCYAVGQWGTFSQPFAANSPWNSRPINPQFDDFIIPESQYVPSISAGSWSTGVFLSKPSDSSTTVSGSQKQGYKLNIPGQPYDSQVVIPHWPQDVIPASGDDGHADIIDEENNIIHSFWQLHQENGKWVASLYAWSKLNGTGWPDASHWYQGARATGVPASAGLIRKFEYLEKSESYYKHALSMSLTFNALSANPAFIYPARNADWDAEKTNSGKIPEGALMMLPANFDTTLIKNKDIKKIAETLKRYGAYVVDRNVGTPYSIYAEIGIKFDIHKNGWSNQDAADLQLIRRSLRQVLKTDGWIDGDGNSYPATSN